MVYDFCMCVFVCVGHKTFYGSAHILVRTTHIGQNKAQKRVNKGKNPAKWARPCRKSKGLQAQTDPRCGQGIFIPYALGLTLSQPAGAKGKVEARQPQDLPGVPKIQRFPAPLSQGIYPLSL